MQAHGCDGSVSALGCHFGNCGWKLKTHDSRPDAGRCRPQNPAPTTATHQSNSQSQQLVSQSGSQSQADSHGDGHNLFGFSALFHFFLSLSVQPALEPHDRYPSVSQLGFVLHTYIDFLGCNISWSLASEEFSPAQGAQRLPSTADQA